MWCGALNQNVIDAHGHKVDAHGVMFVVHEREFELRSHAVSGGNKHRLRHIAYIGAEKSTEAADVGKHSLGVRLGDEGFDLGYQTVAGLNIDAGFRIGFRPFCRHKHSLSVAQNSKSSLKAQYAWARRP